MAATANWSYAVPLEETDGNARPLATRRDTDTDARSIHKRNSAWDLQSDSETARHRRTSLRANNNAAGRKRSRNALREKRQQDEKKTDSRVDDSAWIHRDKLAQIEIQEMEEAGIYVRPSRRSMSAGPGRENGRTSRSVSRSGTRPGSRTSHDRQNDILNDEDYTNAYPGYDESPRKRVSTVPSAPEEEPTYQEQAFDPYRDSEIRSPREVADEQYTQRQQQQQHMGRPSTSRIPVSRISPVPVPQTVTDRDSPLPRSRAGSQNWTGSFDEMQYARRIRSPSISSQVLLDADMDGSKITPPGTSNKTSSNDENSPPKSRVPRKTAPTGRKTSTSSARPGSSHQNKRAPSASATKRPGSSSGHKSRPSTGRHSPPEGEPPWIATMYKPDPRLPPDQQMLPTHAKRMAQEQWEKEGKTGSAYDRDFKLLNDEDISKPKAPILSIDSRNLSPPVPRSPSPTKRASPNGSANGPWPLSPSKSDTKSDGGSVRPGTSGGYKITPTITSTPNFPRSPVPSAGPPAPAPAISHTTARIPDIDEKQEAEAKPKKGCCCVVM